MKQRFDNTTIGTMIILIGIMGIALCRQARYPAYDPDDPPKAGIGLKVNDANAVGLKAMLEELTTEEQRTFQEESLKELEEWTQELWEEEFELQDADRQQPDVSNKGPRNGQ